MRLVAINDERIVSLDRQIIGLMFNALKPCFPKVFAVMFASHASKTVLGQFCSALDKREQRAETTGGRSAMQEQRRGRHSDGRDGACPLLSRCFLAVGGNTPKQANSLTDKVRSVVVSRGTLPEIALNQWLTCGCIVSATRKITARCR